MFKVYHMEPAARYGGFVLIGAMSAGEANEYIADFKERDVHNFGNAYGWTYVYEEDIIKELTSSIAGIIYDCTYYNG